PPVLDSQGLPKLRGQQDDLRIDLGATKPQRFGADLMKLPISAALRTLASEHGAHVVEPLAALIQEVVLADRTHNASSGFRAQREVFCIAVLVGAVLER